MAKKKPGLHKKLSSIFDGVDVPGACDSGQADSTPVESTGWDSRSEGGVSPAGPSVDAVTETSDVAPAADLTLSGGVSGASVPHEHVFGTSKPRAQKRVASAADRRQTVMKGLVGALTVVFVIVIVVFYTPLFSNEPRSAAASDQVGASEDGQEDVEVGWKIPEALGELARNPMQRAGVGRSSEKSAGADDPPAAQVDAIVVRGIMYSQDNPAAIVGQDLVHQGEMVFGVKVSRIFKNQVEFELDGKKWTQGVQSSQ